MEDVSQHRDAALRKVKTLEAGARFLGFAVNETDDSMATFDVMKNGDFSCEFTMMESRFYGDKCELFQLFIVILGDLNPHQKTRGKSPNDLEIDIFLGDFPAAGCSGDAIDDHLNGGARDSSLSLVMLLVRSIDESVGVKVTDVNRCDPGILWHF